MLVTVRFFSTFSNFFVRTLRLRWMSIAQLGCIHCMYIVYAIPSLNKDVIVVVVIIIIIIIIILLLSVRGEPCSHHLTVTHPSTSHVGPTLLNLPEQVKPGPPYYNSLQETFYQEL